MQISGVLRNKEEINKLWITNSNENSKNVKLQKTETSETIYNFQLVYFCSFKEHSH